MSDGYFGIQSTVFQPFCTFEIYCYKIQKPSPRNKRNSQNSKETKNCQNKIIVSQKNQSCRVKPWSDVGLHQEL